MALAEEKRFYTAEEGVKMAQTDISRGNLNLLRYGIPSASAEIDKETGLTIETLGCEIWPGMEDYIESYNKTMRQHVLGKKRRKIKSMLLETAPRAKNREQFENHQSHSVKSTELRPPLGCSTQIFVMFLSGTDPEGESLYRGS